MITPLKTNRYTPELDKNQIFGVFNVNFYFVFEIDIFLKNIQAPNIQNITLNGSIVSNTSKYILFNA